MLTITHIPQEEPRSRDFEIRLNGEIAEAAVARVSAMPFNCIWPGHQRPLDQTEEAPFLSFAMDEPVQVELTAARDFEEVVVRPLSKNIQPEICGRTIRFTIEKPGQYTVELDGWHHALHVFADPAETFDICPEDENVIYYGPGVHRPGVVFLQSGQTVYVHRDAVVYGSFVAMNADGVRILGSGVIDGSDIIRGNNSMLVPKDVSRRNSAMDIYSPIQRGTPCSDIIPTGTQVFAAKEQMQEFLSKWNYVYGCIHLFNCTNTEINGPILRDSAGFTVIEANCINAVCDNVKLLTWRYNSDGIDIFNSQNCIIRNCFLRNFDDCVVLKGIVGWDTWNMENILVENCVVWCDWGRNLEIGAETNAPAYQNIIFRDCDCIHCTHIALDIQHSDWAEIHDVLFENIRVEYSRHDVAAVYQSGDDSVFTPVPGKALAIVAVIAPQQFSNYPQKGSISRVQYRNIQILTEEGAACPGICFRGWDEEHTVSDIVIEGLTHNGVPVIDSSVLECGGFAKNIVLK